jgi:hypothetical protein
MHTNAFLLQSCKINDNARSFNQNSETMHSCIDMEAKRLFQQGPFAIRLKSGSLPNPFKVRANEIDGQVSRDAACRLVVVSFTLEPTGKVMQSRVSSCIVSSTYVPSVNLEEISLAIEDSSVRGSRHIQQVASWELCAIAKPHLGICPFSKQLRKSAPMLSFPGI